MSVAIQLGRLMEEGVRGEDAAEMLGLSPAVAKLAGASGASELDFSDEDLKDALAGVAEIARSGEHERNRLTASIFVIEVKKKLRVSRAPETQNNITLVQQLINAANADVNQFARSLSARDGRRDPVAIEEPRQTGEGPATQLAGARLQPAVEYTEKPPQRNNGPAQPDHSAEPPGPPGPNFPNIV